MSKLSYEDKIKIYKEREKGKKINEIAKKYGVRIEIIEYMIRLIKRHGIEVLRTTKNKYYSKGEKERIIKRVIKNKESINAVAIDEGLLSRGMLQQWIHKYKENGYNVVELKRGRKTMSKDRTKDKRQEERIQKLEEENRYLKAKIEYLKKLRAVVQARKNRQSKKE